MWTLVRRMIYAAIDLRLTFILTTFSLKCPEVIVAKMEQIENLFMFVAERTRYVKLLKETADYFHPNATGRINGVDYVGKDSITQALFVSN